MTLRIDSNNCTISMPEPVNSSVIQPALEQPESNNPKEPLNLNDHVQLATTSSTDDQQPRESLKQTVYSDLVATTGPVYDEDDPLYHLKVKKECKNLPRSTSLPNQRFKFTSAETESNTHANAYSFGPLSYNSPLISPSYDFNNGLMPELIDKTDCLEIQRQRGFASGTPRSNHRVRGSRSRSTGGFNGSSRTGSCVEGYFIDPHSPSASFAHRVSFDTFDNKYATDFSLTLQSKHQEYEYSRLSRTFMCGTDENKYSEHALAWMLEKLADDGDEILCLRVIDPSSKLSSSDRALEEKQYRDEAHKFLEHMISKNTKNKKISLILEFAVGRVGGTIKRMIQIYEPSILVVGTKGRSIEGFKGLLPGSVSKWCLQHSPIPVVVVKPESKREQSKSKREADPTQLSYLDIISAHSDETPKVYDHMSSSNLLAPQLPFYLRRSLSASMPSSMLSSITSLDPEYSFRSFSYSSSHKPSV